MTDDRSLERAARLWLEIGPTQAPDRPIETALALIEHTPQERAWPRPFDGERWRLGDRPVLAVAVLAVVLVGGVAILRPDHGPGPAISPSPSPSQSPTTTLEPSGSPSPSVQEGGAAYLTSTFVSPLNGYSVIYPDDWVVTPATDSWRAGVTNQWGSTALDELRGSTARFVGASQRLAPGQTAEAWLSDFAAEACITPRDNWLSVPIGGSMGLIDADGCEAPDPPVGKGGALYDAVVILDGRAYDFTMDGELSHTDFVALLATVRLDPASAVDPTSSP
jgi:hypothetical protein